MMRCPILSHKVEGSVVLIVLCGVFSSLGGCDKVKQKVRDIVKESTKPEVPVVVSHRDSVVGNGKVAIFSNQTAQRLTITVEYDNSRSLQSKTQAIDLPPNGQQEVGWLQGWAFESGETIRISHPSYSTKTWKIP